MRWLPNRASTATIWWNRTVDAESSCHQESLPDHLDLANVNLLMQDAEGASCQSAGLAVKLSGSGTHDLISSENTVFRSLQSAQQLFVRSFYFIRREPHGNLEDPV